VSVLLVALSAIALATTETPPPPTEPAVDAAPESTEEPAPSESATTSEPDEPPTLEALVENAERLLSKNKHALALEQVSYALDDGGLDRALHARARLVEGQAHLALGDVEAARESLAVAILCGATIPPTTDPIARGVHEAAALRAAETPVVVRVDVAKTSRPGLAITLVDDGAHRVVGLRLWTRARVPSASAKAPEVAVETVPATTTTTTADTVMSVELSGAQPIVFFEPPTDEEILRTEVVDHRGNALVELDLSKPTAPAAVASTEAPARFVIGPHLLTAAGGAVVLAGAIGMATFGTLAALADRGSSTFTPETKVPLLVGVAAAFVVVLAGGAVVVGSEVWRMIREDTAVDEPTPDGP